MVSTRKVVSSLLVGLVAVAIAACGARAAEPHETDSADAALIDLCRRVVSEVLGDDFVVAGFTDNGVPTQDDSLTDVEEFGDPSLVKNVGATQCLVIGNEVPERQARVIVALPSEYFVRVGTVG